MKKITIITLAVLCVALLCVAAACEPEDQLPQKYKITCASGEGYSVSDLPSESAEGSTVYFYVEATSVFYQIDKVTFNGTEIYEDDFGTYSFKMPAADVTVQVTATPAPEYDDPDDHLAWGSTVTGFISQASPSDQTASWDVRAGYPPYLPRHILCHVDNFGGRRLANFRRKRNSRRRHLLRKRRGVHFLCRNCR